MAEGKGPSSGRKTIKIIKGSLDVIKINGEERMVLRGVIDPDSFDLLRIASYQREILPRSSVNEIEEALIRGEVPDIDLGMRGSSVRNVKEEGGEVFYLSDDTYIVDGLQRVTATRNLIAKRGDFQPRLGTTIHLNTTEDWERKRFHILNSDRVRVNSNITLRNMAPDLQSIAMLLKMTREEKSWPLHGKVSWEQRMSRGNIITGVTALKAVARLHGHIGPGRSSKVDDLARGFEKIMGTAGKNILRENIKTFFEVIDQCWGISIVTYRDSNPQISAGFLRMMAGVFSDHTDFWEGNRLVVKADLRRKLKLFLLNDPYIRELCGSGGSASDILAQLMVKHINSGKRTRRLTPREGYPEIEDDSEPEDDSPEKDEE
jgi:hypothetical protein